MMKAIFEKITDLILSPLSLDFDSLGDMHGGLFTEISNYLYLGRRPDELSIPELKQAGITHIVSCLDKEDRPSVDFLKKDFSHLFLGVRDGIHESIETTFPQFFEFTESMMRPHSKSKLFVHCEVGVSRSATLVIAEIMKGQTIGFFDAFKRVKAKRNQVLPNIGFASQLQKLELDYLSNDQVSSYSSLALYLYHICNLPTDIELIQSMLEQYNYNAEESIKAIFGGEIPRVIQGVKL